MFSALFSCVLFSKSKSTILNASFHFLFSRSKSTIQSHLFSCVVCLYLVIAEANAGQLIKAVFSDKQKVQLKFTSGACLCNQVINNLPTIVLDRSCVTNTATLLFCSWEHNNRFQYQVCACVHACVRACVCVCVFVCVCCECVYFQREWVMAVARENDVVSR